MENAVNALNRPVKLLVVTGSPLDGTSWYRAVLPLQQMALTYPIDVTVTDRVDWSVACGVDLAFMHRPDSEEAIGACRLLNAFGVPVWADYDDCIMSIPGRNPFYPAGRMPVLVDHLVKIAGLVQAITVSTEPVKEQYTSLHPNVFILPNAYPEVFYDRFKMPERTDDRLRILWRGSDSQVMNLKMLAPVIEDTIAKYPNVDWIIHSGQYPYFLMETVPSTRIKHVQWKHIPEVFISLMESAADIGVVSLFDDTFDRGRSPTVAYELSMSAPCLVAPTWYDFPGIQTYAPMSLADNPITRYTTEELAKARGNLKEVLESVIEMPADQRKQHGLTTQSFVRDTCSLEKVNAHRWKLIQKLLTLPKTTVNIKIES